MVIDGTIGVLFQNSQLPGCDEMKVNDLSRYEQKCVRIEVGREHGPQRKKIQIFVLGTVGARHIGTVWVRENFSENISSDVESLIQDLLFCDDQ